MVNSAVTLSVSATLNTEEIDKQIKSLSKQKVKIPVTAEAKNFADEIESVLSDQDFSIKLNIDKKHFEKQLDELLKPRTLKVNIETDDKNVSSTGGSKKQSGGINSKQLYAAADRVSDRNDKAIKSVTDVLKESKKKDPLAGVKKTLGFTLGTIAQGGLFNVGAGLTRSAGNYAAEATGRFSGGADASIGKFLGEIYGATLTASKNAIVGKNSKPESIDRSVLNPETSKQTSDKLFAEFKQLVSVVASAQDTLQSAKNAVSGIANLNVSSTQRSFNDLKINSNILAQNFDRLSNSSTNLEGSFNQLFEEINSLSNKQTKGKETNDTRIVAPRLADIKQKEFVTVSPKNQNKTVSPSQASVTPDRTISPTTQSRTISSVSTDIDLIKKKTAEIIIDRQSQIDKNISEFVSGIKSQKNPSINQAQNTTAQKAIEKAVAEIDAVMDNIPKEQRMSDPVSQALSALKGNYTRKAKSLKSQSAENQSQIKSSQAIAGADPKRIDELEAALRGLQSYVRSLEKQDRAEQFLPNQNSLRSLLKDIEKAIKSADNSQSPSGTMYKDRFKGVIANLRRQATKIERDIDFGEVEVKNIDVDVVNGLKNGINSRLKDISKVGKEIGIVLSEGTKKALGIRSPSKLYAYYGKQINIGLAQGIKSSRIEPLKANKKTIESLKERLKDLEGASRQLQRSRIQAVAGVLKDNTIQAQDKITEIRALLSQLDRIEKLINADRIKTERSIQSRGQTIDARIPEAEKKVKVKTRRTERAKEQFANNLTNPISLLAGETANSLKRLNEESTSLIRSQRRLRTLQEKSLAARERQSLESWDRTIRYITSIAQRRLLRGLPGRERREQVGNIAGFTAGAGLLIAPGFIAKVAGIVGALATAFPVTATAAIVSKAISPLINIAIETLEKTERARQRFNYISPGNADREFNYAVDFADQFDVPIEAALQQSSKLFAASVGSTLDLAQTKELYEGIVLASKALALNQEDLNLVFLAFSQVLNKGKLSAEEIRNQLGERLLGTLSIFASSLGVSALEFNKLLESGNLLAGEVLPKVSKELKRRFGDSAEQTANAYIDSANRIQNAFFKIQMGIGNALKPMITFFNQVFGGLVTLISDNMAGISKVFTVVMIGLAAQTMVGLEVIVGRFLPKITNMLIPLTTSFATALVPLAAGIASDFLDDLGADTSMFQNMVEGVSNVIIGLFTLVESALNSFDIFLFNDTSYSEVDKFSTSLGSLLDGLKSVMRIVPSTVIEFAALFLMFTQLQILGKLAIAPQIERFVQVFGSFFKLINRNIINLKMLSIGFAEATASTFRTAMATKSVGEAISKLSISMKSLGAFGIRTMRGLARSFKAFTKTDLGMNLALAGFILFFAKANILDEKLKIMNASLAEVKKSSFLLGKALDLSGDKIEKATSRSGSKLFPGLIVGLTNAGDALIDFVTDLPLIIDTSERIGKLAADSVSNIVSGLTRSLSAGYQDIKDVKFNFFFAKASLEDMRSELNVFVGAAKELISQSLSIVGEALSDYEFFEVISQENIKGNLSRFADAVTVSAESAFGRVRKRFDELYDSIKFKGVSISYQEIDLGEINIAGFVGSLREGFAAIGAEINKFYDRYKDVDLIGGLGGAVDFKVSLASIKTGFSDFISNLRSASDLSFKDVFSFAIGEASKTQQIIAQNSDQMKNSLRSIREDELEKLKYEVAELQEIRFKIEIERKGFDLLVGIGSYLGVAKFTTDDLIVSLNEMGIIFKYAIVYVGTFAATITATISPVFALAGAVVALVGALSIFNDELMTLGEKQYFDRMFAENELSLTIQANIDKSGLLSNQIFTGARGDIIKDVQFISSEIDALRDKRANLRLEGVEDTSEQIEKIDEQISALESKRSQKSQLVLASVETLQSDKKTLESLREQTLQAKNITDEAKKRRVSKIDFDIRLLDKALEKASKIDESLQPTEYIYAKILENVKATNKELEKQKQIITQINADSKLSIQKKLFDFDINKNEAEFENLKIDVSTEVSELDSLRVAAKDAQSQLKDLYRLQKDRKNPLVSEDMAKNIAEQEKNVAKLKLDLSKKELSVLQKQAQLRRESVDFGIKEIASQRDLDSAKDITAKVNLQTKFIMGDLDAGELERSISQIEFQSIEREIGFKIEEIDLIKQSFEENKISLEEYTSYASQAYKDLFELRKQQKEKEIAIVSESFDRMLSLEKAYTDAVTSQMSAINSRNQLQQQSLELQSKLINAYKESKKQFDNTEEVDNLKKAIEARKTLRDTSASREERLNARKQLNDSGFKAFSSESLGVKLDIAEDVGAKAKAEGLKKEESVQQALLAIERKRAELAAVQAVREAKINQIKNKQLILESKIALQKALISGDKDQIAIAQLGVLAAKEQNKLGIEELGLSLKNLAVEQQISQLKGATDADKAINQIEGLPDLNKLVPNLPADLLDLLQPKNNIVDYANDKNIDSSSNGFKVQEIKAIDQNLESKANRASNVTDKSKAILERIKNLLEQRSQGIEIINNYNIDGVGSTVEDQLIEAGRASTQDFIDQIKFGGLGG